MYLALNKLQRLICYKTQTTNQSLDPIYPKTKSFYLDSLPQAGSNTGSIFKRSKAGLNSEFPLLLDQMPNHG